jgi:predicted metal-dependent enzyme (double-stranded beta helix superfamily)
VVEYANKQGYAMHDALKPDIASWTQRILDSISTCIDADNAVDAPRLAKILETSSTWQGCPRAEDVLNGSPNVSYQRVPLTDSATHSYEALLIIWPPDHATPIHDHDGLWGMEFVLDGVLEVEAFDLLLQTEPHLVSRNITVLGIGDHVAFSDADYAHRCRNLSSNRPTLSLHIYGGELNSYRSFHVEDEGRWISKTHHTVREPALV